MKTSVAMLREDIIVGQLSDPIAVTFNQGARNRITVCSVRVQRPEIASVELGVNINTRVSEKSVILILRDTHHLLQVGFWVVWRTPRDDVRRRHGEACGNNITPDCYLHVKLDIIPQV